MVNFRKALVLNDIGIWLKRFGRGSVQELTGLEMSKAMAMAMAMAIRAETSIRRTCSQELT
eukprot:scaffold243558_cov17-Prasinocladus_malaysianus.AAC.1